MQRFARRLHHYSRMEGNPTRPEQLLGQLSWIRGLVQSLVRDQGDADEVAQLTWIAAQERDPQTLSNGWLSAVARNIYRQRLRRDGARSRRERLHAVEEALPSAEELALRTERQQLVLAAVTKLAEPYRRLVILRYMDGLASAEIARRQAVPAATVRSQLKRALAMLREELDDEFGSRQAWSAFLLPLAVGPSTVPVVLSPGIPAGKAALVAGGSLAMKQWIGIVLVLMVCLVGVSMMASLDGDEDKALVQTDEKLLPAAEPVADLVASQGQSFPAATRKSLGSQELVQSPAAAASPTGWWLTGRVRGWEGVEPPLLHVWAAGDYGDASLEGHVGTNGQVLLDLAAIFKHESALPTELGVKVTKSGYQSVTVKLKVDRRQRQAGFKPQAKAHFPLEIELTPALATVHGIVSAPADIPLENIWAH